uniref:Fer-1-like protein 5 isoform X4 n=1 Tax=Geotrypetes seraphini TaxID=260995 RepID=A0A6P8RGR8_GEOSA|nr:fer-1-like protein 5 isoform X4 [Geotrypetes seraphini]
MIRLTSLTRTCASVSPVSANQRFQSKQAVISGQPTSDFMHARNKPFYGCREAEFFSVHIRKHGSSKFVGESMEAAIFSYSNGVEKRTKALKKCRNPTWNEILEWNLVGQLLDSSAMLDVQLRESVESSQEKSYGTATIWLAPLVTDPNKPLSYTDLPLVNNYQQPGCTITLTAFYILPTSATGEVKMDNVKEKIRDSQKASNKENVKNKPQQFQVRVRIIEGRQLQGTNLKPVVKVLIGEYTHWTRIKRGNNPSFNEIFFQNLHKSPSQLFDDTIHIQVLNSQSLRADSMIGIFKMEIGSVYYAPGHYLLRKWLTLYDPEYINSGVRGYLKVSVYVLGAGDHAPMEEATASENDDVESNLLTPVAMPIRMATIMVRIYRAEDIPYMDESFSHHFKHIFQMQFRKKSCINSFVELSFAGITLKTKVIHLSKDPEWNQLLCFPIQFPSMCDKIKLTILNWNQLGNEAFGTTFISLSQVSSRGTEIEGDYSGFLPCFGPSFLNLYGSPREFTEPQDPYSKLNNELMFLYRLKYCLCGVFYSASMLPCITDLVQFEVSMGNYGNKFDVTCKPLSSTTQYSRAVFDGNFYYYLPWYDTKPVAALNCFWEDVRSRIDALNIMQALYDKLKQNLNELKRVEGSHDPSLMKKWKKLLQDLLKQCKRSLPPLGQVATVLDEKLQDLRNLLLEDIVRWAQKLQRDTCNPLTFIPKLEDWLQRIASVTYEPQTCLPDVVIWMLCKEKRVAYARVKAHTIMFSSTSQAACGKFCGRTQTILLKYLQSKKNETNSSVQLRVQLWLGPASERMKLNNYWEGKLVVYAETYENQVKIFGKWCSKRMSNIPKFSDITGLLSLPKDKFQLPNGWDWNGDWKVEPQKRLLLDGDTNYSEILEQVYENEIREPGEEWVPAEVPNTTEDGTACYEKEEILCPPDWFYRDDWKVELNRAVDDAGWEYSVGLDKSSISKSWHSAEKTYHTHRRRRWVRTRFREINQKKSDIQIASFLNLQTNADKKPVDPPQDVWEYAPLCGWKFHLNPHTNDMFRRRCWRRMLIPKKNIGSAAVFLLEGSLGVEFEDLENESIDETEKIQQARDIVQLNTPFINCVYQRPTSFQLRCYIFQARHLVPAHSRTFTNPYAHVSFLYKSQRTEVLSSTLHPIWNQTLLFHDVLIYGTAQRVLEDCPFVTVELFDKTSVGKDEYLGRCLFQPVVYLDLDARVIPQLEWYPIRRQEKSSGDLSAAVELLCDKMGKGLPELLSPPEKVNKTLMVPKEIRPTLKPMIIEILAWGLRGMKSHMSPSLLIECEDESIQTAQIRCLKKNPNFPSCLYILNVYLPEEISYLPPIKLKVLDNRPFGYKPVMGQTSVWNLRKYYCNPFNKGLVPDLPLRVTSSIQMLKVLEETSGITGKKEEEDFDWWSKFYASLGEHANIGNYLEKGYDTLKVFGCALEEVPQFQGLQDFCQTFKLYRGTEEDDENDPFVVGEVKCSFRIYSISEDPEFPKPPRQFKELPNSAPQDCLIRVYIIRGLNLQPRDRNGLCDPYIRIAVGKDVKDDRQHYQSATLDPVFGKMFEMSCVIPLEKDLTVSLYDFDFLSPDQKIGETVVDLENRLLSQFGANCGLPKTYCISGPNVWRDQLTPIQLIENFAKLKNWTVPQFSDDGKSAIMKSQKIWLSDFEQQLPSHRHLGHAKQRLALHLLRTQGQVPEHVETRTLYNPLQPGMDQGKIQMWVDIFPKSMGPPGLPCNISPRIPKKYELRCIVWNTKDVDLKDITLTGIQMSDIYVKGWIEGMEEDKQQTDIHYQSLGGEGNFNWRFVFSFDYLPMEQLCVLSKRESIWSVDKRVTKIPPKLIIQIWDNDRFSFDDFIGVLELNLIQMPHPKKNAADCSLQMVDYKETAVKTVSLFNYLKNVKLFGLSKSHSPRISLFKERILRGWWPCIILEKNACRISGKVELTLEVLKENEIEKHPAGKGREEPNIHPKLDVPIRPEASYNWLRSPLTTFKHILWRPHKAKVTISILTMCIILFVILFIYSIPGYLTMKWINPFGRHLIPVVQPNLSYFDFIRQQHPEETS